MKNMFILIVLHNVGHLEDTSIVLLTESLENGVYAARDGSKGDLKYEFRDDGTGFILYQIEKDRKYSKEDLSVTPGKVLPDTFPIIYRLRYNSRTKAFDEDWPIQKFREEFKMAPTFGKGGTHEEQHEEQSVA